VWRREGEGEGGRKEGREEGGRKGGRHGRYCGSIMDGRAPASSFLTLGWQLQLSCLEASYIISHLALEAFSPSLE
jgi:hypothetical protein